MYLSFPACNSNTHFRPLPLAVLAKSVTQAQLLKWGRVYMGFEPGLLREKRKRYLCAMRPPTSFILIKAIKTEARIVLERQINELEFTTDYERVW